MIYPFEKITYRQVKKRLDNAERKLDRLKNERGNRNSSGNRMSDYKIRKLTDRIVAQMQKIDAIKEQLDSIVPGKVGRPTMPRLRRRATSKSHEQRDGCEKK